MLHSMLMFKNKQKSCYSHFNKHKGEKLTSLYLSQRTTKVTEMNNEFV